MIHVLYGSDSFALHEALTELKAELDADGMLGTNTTRLEGGQLQPQDLVAVCQALPFLGAYRLVVVEGLLGRFERAPERRRGRRERPGRRPAREGPDGLGPWRDLPDMLAAMPPSTVLVLVDDDIAPKNPLLELLSPLGTVRPFPLMKRRGEIEAWIAARAHGRGLAISREAVRRLADLVGPNLWVLSSEIEKLAVYSGGRTVTEEDVDALSPAVREANVFTLVDAVVEGRTQVACQVLERALQDGQTVSGLFSLIVRHYRNLLLAKEMVGAGLNAQQVGARLRVYNEFALNKLLDQASRATARQLEAGHRRLLEADASGKRGIYPEEVALELLVVDLARLASPAAPAPRSFPRRRAPAR